MKAIRTISEIKETEYKGSEKPKYKLNQYMEVYNGPYEGHNFWIKDIRFNYDINKFEYLYDAPLMGGWYAENCIIAA